MKKGKSIELSYAEIMANPLYEHLREGVMLLHESRFEDLFPEKHLLALKALTLQNLQNLYCQTPFAPLKNVVMHTLSFLPDDTSAKMVIELTRFTIEKWAFMATRANAKV